jgi:hypothetical protein
MWLIFLKEPQTHKQVVGEGRAYCSRLMLRQAHIESPPCPYVSGCSSSSARGSASLENRKRLTNRTYHFAAELGKPRTNYIADEVGARRRHFSVSPSGGRQHCELANWAVGQPRQDRTR